MANVLILKKRGQQYRVEIGPNERGRFIPRDCNMEVNMHDYKHVALFLEDLKTWNVPIDKAIEEYKKKNKERDPSTPFW
jgi:hypothetical protein